MERIHHLGSDLRVNPYVYMGHAFAVKLAAHEKLINLEPEKATDWRWVPREFVSRVRMILGTKKYVRPALQLAQQI